MKKDVGYLLYQVGEIVVAKWAGASASAAAHRRLLAEHAVGLHGLNHASMWLAGFQDALGADADVISPQCHITTRCLTKTTMMNSNPDSQFLFLHPISLMPCVLTWFLPSHCAPKNLRQELEALRQDYPTLT